jgi:hypothetical protein
MAGLGETIKSMPPAAKATGLVAGLVAAASAPLAVITTNPLWKFLLAGIVLMFVVLVVIKLLFSAKDKAKSSPFAGLIAKSAAGRAGADPAAKARMDDLRKKFEEGVEVFKSAGKDLYSLPWFLLVGPSGTGKTEMVRHSQIGFPPGLQDALQGSGGTINMNWWFSNSAVILDTAGRMFMEEREDNSSTEWKELLKLLRAARANCPISGLLLVLSAESLLRESSEKLEQIAGTVARQLDTIQRTLDVRFPVTVVVTKCDMIVGFRDYFETLNDPNAQHQILGWVNPAQLDEKFQPDQVDKHLETVRQKLLKRRMGLMQNPVHTVDASARRTDQVDELFELPDNLMRIAPRLRRYLDLIFTAGEWSPKPLFLRGIYFTSSMREGEALDMSLSQALGVSVDSLPGGREWDKDKAYFIRDVFLNKVFKEKGLVTRATNVSASIRKQRTLLGTVSIVALLVLGGISVIGWLKFKDSVGPPSAFWQQVRSVTAPDEKSKTADLRYFTLDDKDQFSIVGREPLAQRGDLESDYSSVVKLLAGTTDHTTEVKTPAIFGPIRRVLGLGKDFVPEQVGAHRAVFEQAVVLPLLDAARSKLSREEKWGPDAVAALAQFVRIRTFTQGFTPADRTATGKNTDASAPLAAIDVEGLFRYVAGSKFMEDPQLYPADQKVMRAAIEKAYGKGWSESGKPSAPVAGKVSNEAIRLAMEGLTNHLKALGASPDSDMDRLQQLQDWLSKYANAERGLLGVPALSADAAAAPKSMADWAKFEEATKPSFEALAQSREKIDQLADKLGASADDPMGLLTKAGNELVGEVTGYYKLLEGQLPAAPADAKIPENKDIADARAGIQKQAKDAQDAVQAKLGDLKKSVATVAALMAPGKAGAAPARSYAARADAYKVAGDVVLSASAAGGDAKQSLVFRLAEADKARQDAEAKSKAWEAWVVDGTATYLTEDARKLANAGGSASISASRKALDVATARRRAGLIADAIKNWPADSKAMGERVRQVADEKLAAGKWARPAVPMTDLEVKPGDKDAGEFKREFHPAAASDVLGDWGTIATMLSDTNSLVLGKDDLRKDIAFGKGQDVTGAYTKDYAKYWADQVRDASPRVRDWQEFTDRASKEDAAGINRVLGDLRKVANDAIKAIPPALAGSDDVKLAASRISEDFGKIGDDAYEDMTRKMLRSWRNLAQDAGGAAGSRDRVLMLMKDKDALREELFLAYKQRPIDGSRYWNEFAKTGLKALVDATSGGLAEARNQIVASKGVPLTMGEGQNVLTPEQVAKARDSAAKLAGVAGAGGEGAAFKPFKSADFDDDTVKLFNRLGGASVLAGDEVWFRQVKAVLDAIYDPKAATAQPVLRMKIVGLGSGQPKGGAGENARDVYRYAGLRMGGKAFGKSFNIAGSDQLDKARADELTTALPTESDGLEIWLSKNDFDNLGAAAAPGPVIQIPGKWGLLTPMLSGESQRGPDGTWTILVKSGSEFLWLKVEFDPKLPDAASWPSASTWPGK